ncbi:MAG: Transcriptional regulatory protein ZraR [Alphaproteobacteria bacterium MarineAlpha5_Bin11]|nr:sigma-54-dependent Fis family transcriptional regulator [Pelagibacteraceae bacterium]PPR43931.1 MAG: Transcriptional regulatory protein ZraR [Alphaproteobacteria bacterium MarineAlpha5_Bin11]|tara:strand:- start:22246 stop:23610 length:1365 start_codon:yes stop_codon:yes gene_type:complete
MKYKILIIDDEKDICFLISEILSDENYTTSSSHNSSEAIENFNKFKPDLIILDVWLDKSQMDGLELLKYFKKINKYIPIIIISGHSTVDMAVQAIKDGAYDFLEKPFDTNKLLIITKRAIENSKLIEENIELKKINYENYNIIGKSQFAINIKNILKKISPTTGRVLIYGPPGSGKEIIARNIHNLSLRKDKSFVIFNCASINPESIGENLFGSTLNDQMSFIERANGGTILFDEIADIPIEIQGVVLKFLQESTYQKIGSNEDYTSDVRIITTTNKNLEIEVEKGNFRSDLFYRLNVIPINIPSLENRPEDIRLLCDHFIKNSHYYNNKHISIAEDAYAVLESYSWPGNIRQLKNLIDRILIMHNDKSKEIIINAAKLPQDMGEINSKNTNEKMDVLGLPIKDARESFERKYLISQIRRFNGNMTMVATFIGMERTALYRKLKSLKINSDNYK